MEGTHLLLAVTRMALALAQQVLPLYSHPKSPHQFTQPQLLACLIVKAYLRQSYRGIVELLALSDALRRVRPQPLVADAGYDAAWVHEFCRERWRVSSWIPLAVRSQDGQVRGRWRFPMREMPKVYRQRWHVESFLSGLNRTTGSQLTTRR
jgi:hypothetical protein